MLRIQPHSSSHAPGKCRAATTCHAGRGSGCTRAMCLHASSTHHTPRSLDSHQRMRSCSDTPLKHRAEHSHSRSTLPTFFTTHTRAADAPAVPQKCQVQSLQQHVHTHTHTTPLSALRLTPVHPRAANTTFTHPASPARQRPHQATSAATLPARASAKLRLTCAQLTTCRVQPPRGSSDDTR